MDSSVNKYFRPSLLSASESLTAYGSRPPAACDLGLISGPCIWEQEIRSALAADITGLLAAYPLPNQSPRLLQLIAAHEQVDVGGIWLTPGADVALEVVLRQLLGAGDHMAVLCPNFPRFAVVAATIEGVTSSKHFAIDDLPLQARVIVLCSPCNPTTAEIPLQQLRALIGARPDTMFCIDGAFDWYSSAPLSQLCREFPNVILIKSFSKIGLAGLRLGYVVTRPDTHTLLELGQSPFSVPALIQHIGAEVAVNFHRIAEIRELIEQRWLPLRRAFGAHAQRYSPVPFYLLQVNTGSARAAEMLAAEGISVVKGASFDGLASNLLRVAIGNDQQNALFIDTVDRLGLMSH